MEKKAMKRWTKEETNLILGYIIEKGYLERPTAQIFYRKLLEEIEIEDATWELLRYRMRNLKTTLKKANDYRESMKAGLGDEEGMTPEAIEERVRKICPHYDQLSYIFDNNGEMNKKHSKFEYIEFSEVSQASENSRDSLTLETSWSSPTVAPISSPTAPSLFSPAAPTPSKPLPEPTRTKLRRFSEHTKRPAPKSEYEDIVKLENKRDEFLQKKLELEKEKIKIEWKKIKMQEEDQAKRLEMDQEIQHMRMKIEQDKLQIAFQLKKYEIDQKERIAKYELELKYNKRN